MESLITSTLSNVHQIYFDAKTRGQCWEGFRLYDNSNNLSPFFENKVIYDLCMQGAHREGGWFGILSPSFFFKAHRIKTPRNLSQLVSEGDHDAVGFNGKSQNQNVILQAERWHVGFVDLFEKIIHKAGIGFDFRSVKNGKQNIFSNYLIAKPEVWDRYFTEVLKPCMDVMSRDKEVQEGLWQDAKYHKSRTSLRHRMYLQESIGVPFYPYHTFICERFWTLFLWMNPDVKLKNI